MRVKRRITYLWRGKMARRQVLEVTCDRCKKTETQDIESVPEKGDELEVTFHGQKVKYGDLCKRCRSACENYFKSMTKQPDEEDDKSKEPKAVPPGKPTGFLGIGNKKAG
jgi:hypothetical protein